jgi:hypothetical protein
VKRNSHMRIELKLITKDYIRIASLPILKQIQEAAWNAYDARTHEGEYEGINECDEYKIIRAISAEFMRRKNANKT